MIEIKSSQAIDAIRKGSKVVALMLEQIRNNIKVGMKKSDLDHLAANILDENNAQTAFKGYQGFPNNICVSINNELIHGFADDTIINDGDLVSIDAGAVVDGYYADAAITIGVGNVKPEYEHLIEVTRQALTRAIMIVKPGVRIGDIGATIQDYVEAEGYFLPKDYTGHGIGRNLHEEPYIPNYGVYGRGMKLRAGMTICIEPMVQIGTDKTKVLPDNWTVVSANGQYSAHFEHTILVTNTGCEILTKNNT